MDAENLPTTIEGCHAHILALREEMRVMSIRAATLIRDLDIATNMVLKARDALTPTTENWDRV